MARISRKAWFVTIHKFLGVKYRVKVSRKNRLYSPRMISGVFRVKIVGVFRKRYNAYITAAEVRDQKLKTWPYAILNDERVHTFVPFPHGGLDHTDYP